MRIRFHADANLKQAIVTGMLRRNAGVDFQRADGVPLVGLEDPEVLAIAAKQGRVVVTHDVSTMESHFREFIQEHRSPGLILIPQTSVSVGECR